MLSTIPKETLTSALEAHYPTYPSVWAEHTAQRIIMETDARLEPNVAQFIAGQPLDDIWVSTSQGRMFSVATIMERQGRDDFVAALDSMSYLLAGREALAMQLIAPVRL